MGQRNRGWYERFYVSRVDGSSEPGKKHHNCKYLVADLTHDPHAIPAALAYADSCEKDGYKLLARDLRNLVAEARGATLLNK